MKRHSHNTSFVLTALMVLGQVAYYGAAPPTLSEWLPPVNLGPVVNSAVNDFGPAISKDRLSLYLGSTRPGRFGSTSHLCFSAGEPGRPMGTTDQSRTKCQHALH